MEQIEGHIRDVFDEVRYDHPRVNCVSFEVSVHNSGRIGFCGYIHRNNGCRLFRSASELKAILVKMKGNRAGKEILFRKFS